MNRCFRAFALITLFALPAVPAYAQAARALPDREPWPPDVVEMAASLPVQEGGRVKPLSTFAGFTMLKLNGKRSFSYSDDVRLSPTEWLLDTLYRPNVARDYRVFLIQDTALLRAINVPDLGRKRRDRFSYNELVVGRDALMQAAQQISSRPAQERAPLEQQAINLANNLFEYEQLVDHFAFAREPLPVEPGGALAQLLGENSYTAVLERATLIRLLVVWLGEGAAVIEEQLPPEQAAHLRDQLPGAFLSLDEETREAALAELQQVLSAMERFANQSTGLAMLPPSDPETREWLSPGGVFQKAFFSGEPPDAALDLLRLYGNTAEAAASGQGFEESFAAFREASVARAQERDEYDKVPLEVALYEYRLFPLSLYLFVLSFLLVAVSWLAPRVRFLYGLSLASLFPPLALLIAGITLRCIIRGRPPVTTLYETILFITAVVVIAAIFIEFIDRRRIAVATGAFLGMLGMFLAYKYEVKEGVDTMPSLIAVLDTNFWLSTHVTTVTMGYAAGLLAAAISHVYILGRLLGFGRRDPSIYTGITRMVYGVICFGLVFSVVGTVLGGIWAADSWGRFWGWDPKENGALMIVLWELAILHALKGGYIREMGLHLAAVFNAIIVAFSWWGVNLLGVGLHSYGFTSGIMNALFAFYLLELGVIGLGIFTHARDKGFLAPKEAGQESESSKPARESSAS